MEPLSFRAAAPAKINLWLEVICKRPDGYHDLSSLMLPIGVHDDLEMTLLPEAPGAVVIECDHPDVPADATNLAARAASLYLDAVRQWKTGVQIRLSKRIPAAAGLGGGSSDAGTVLLALNRHSPKTVPPGLLSEMAQTLGADVPFFLAQSPCMATGIGERLRAVPVLPSYPIVLIKPPVATPTKGVYQRLKLTRGEGRIKIAALLEHPWSLAQVMENDLESVTLADHPILADIKAWLVGRGALGALMSGSGPTVFGVFRRREEALQAAALAGKTWQGCWVAASETQGAVS